MENKNILITGASGFIGTALVDKLKSLGFVPVSLSTRFSDKQKYIVKWNPEKEVCDPLPFDSFYAIINLAGASISDTQWNSSGKRLLKNSRVNSTKYLQKIINNLSQPPVHLISASAVGYYGLNHKEPCTEVSKPGDDFAAMVCREWENAAYEINTDSVKLSILRIGIVLGENGGFYGKLKKLSSYKIAAPLATGKQSIPWIHIDDLCKIFIKIIQNELAPGVYNSVASNVSNAEITKYIARKQNQHIRLPHVPSFVLSLIFGEKAEILTKASPISSVKLRSAGFSFKFQDYKLAIDQINSKNN